MVKISAMEFFLSWCSSLPTVTPVQLHYYSDDINTMHIKICMISLQTLHRIYTETSNERKEVFSICFEDFCIFKKTGRISMEIKRQ